MAYFNEKITITLTAVEMATIREALRYAANQVHDSDIPVFENYETIDRSTGEVIFDEDMHSANQDKAELALELADTLDLIEADGIDWEVLNCTSGGHVKDPISVWCRHYKPCDFGTPLVREFIWSYTPKQSALPDVVFTSVLEDRAVPANTQVAVHYVPYDKLNGESLVRYYSLDDLLNKIPIITGDEDVDDTVLEALRIFINYHG